MAAGIERRKLASGQVRYDAYVHVRNGERRQRVCKTFKRMDDARAWRTRMQDTASRGVQIGGSTMRLRDVAAEFTSGMRDGTVRTRNGRLYKPSVVRGYEQALATYILPALGAAPVSKIGRRDVQRLVDRLIADGRHDSCEQDLDRHVPVAASTIRNALKPLQVICRRLAHDGELHVNPCVGLKLPAAPARRERIADGAEAAALLAALPTQQDRAIWATAFYAGLRLGELRELRWSDIDEAAGLVRVRRALDPQAGVIEPRSAAGTRLVPIIRQLRDELTLLRLETGAADDTLVFTSPRRGPVRPGTIYDNAREAWAAAGLEPIGLHEARHSFASHLIASLVNAKAITTYMGHGSIQVTFDTYGHLMPGNEAEAAALLEAYHDRVAR